MRLAEDISHDYSFAKVATLPLIKTKEKDTKGSRPGGMLGL
jgi:hypothetical protein